MSLGRERRRVLGGMAIASLLLSAALWYGGVRQAARVSAGSLTDTAPVARLSLATAGYLPRALQSATPLATSSHTAICTATPQASPATPLPTETASPTPFLSATPTRTPIHNPTDRDPTRLTIPSLGLDTPVVTVGIDIVSDGHGGQVSVWQVANYAAGFHEGTARIGQVGNTVIAGHNNIRGEVFRDVHKLAPGDEIILWLDDWPFRYLVAANYRLPVKDAPDDVLNDNLKWILPTQDQRLTLVTCWPAWGNSHRTIVVAYPAPWSD